MGRGRPKRYENAAEKQKAYRERQKAGVAKLTALDHWRAENERCGQLWNQHYLSFYGCKSVGDWLAERNRLHEMAMQAFWNSTYLESHCSKQWASDEARAAGEPIALKLIAEWEANNHAHK